MKRPYFAGNGRAAAAPPRVARSARMPHPPALASPPLHARTAMKPPYSRQRARRYPRASGTRIADHPPGPRPRRATSVACRQLRLAVHASGATDVARLPPARMPRVARSAPVLPSRRHVRCRPSAAVTVCSARATDVTPLHPVRGACIASATLRPRASRPLHAWTLGTYQRICISYQQHSGSVRALASRARSYAQREADR